MPRVSIAIRAFRRRWLAEAIASVLAQTHRDLELVIYDDAGDLEPLASATGDPRVRYHRAGGRRTASGRFAAAVALCRGAYVGVLDDDDAYAPDFVAELAAALDAHPAVGVAFCRTTWVDDRGPSTPADPRAAGVIADAAAAMLRDGWTVTPSHLLFRRSAYDAVFAEAPMPPDVAPDVQLNVRLALHGWRHLLVDRPLVLTRWHDDQLSRVSIAALDRAIATWRTLALGDPVLARHRDRRLARALLVRAVVGLASGDVGQARADLAAAAGASPAEWRTRRVALQAAAAAGTPGALGAAVCQWWAIRRRRRGPPRRIGD
jgi:glycosyltransferase involved in cell wall biosynthesis